MILNILYYPLYKRGNGLRKTVTNHVSNLALSGLRRMIYHLQNSLEKEYKSIW